MTVCIAAICGDGKNIVVVADRMFTSPLNVEFETEEHKIETLSKTCVAMASGSSAYATEVLDIVRQRFSGKEPLTIQDIANTVKESYTLVRNAKVYEQSILPILGQDFLEELKLKHTIPQYLEKQTDAYNRILAISGQFNLGLDLLIAGIDKTGAHIFDVTNPGTIFVLNKLGYAAVGSGGIHATISLSLCAQTSHRGLTDTLHSVYTAKRVSEVAPGVGRITDVAILSDIETWGCPQILLDSLDKTYIEYTKKAMPDLKQVEEVYNAERKK